MRPKKLSMKPKARWISDLAVEESLDAEEHRESVELNPLKSGPKLNHHLGLKQSA